MKEVIKRDEPVSGTSVGRITLRICSIDWRSGDRPPCIVKIFSSMMAAMGRQLKQSVNVFHSLILYRRLPAKTRRMRGRARGTVGELSARISKTRAGRTFVVEAVNSVDARALVVAPQYEEVLRVLDFVGEEETYRFERLLATVDVVTKEQVVGFWWETAVLEESEQIVVLAMDITWSGAESWV